MINEIFNIYNKVDHQFMIIKVTKLLRNLKIKDQDNIIIIISELSTNILKYANKGKIKLELSNKLIKIISLDDGDGIENIELALKDGFTTSKSLGMGLPAIKRLSNRMEIKTSKKGTKIIVELNLRYLSD